MKANRSALLLGALLFDLWSEAIAAPPVDAQTRGELRESRSRVALTWNAPPVCPDSDWVSSEVERLIGRPPDKEKDPSIQAAATITQTAAGKWRLKLRTLQGDASGERTLEAVECQPLAQAAALIIALSIDPKAVEAGEKTTAARGEQAPKTGVSSASSVTTPTAAAPRGTEKTPAPKSEAASGASPSKPSESVEPPAAETKRAEEEKDDDESESPGSDDQEPAALAVAFGAGLLLDVGSLPGVGAGVGLTAGLELGRLRLEMTANFWPPHQAELEKAPQFGAKLALWTVAPGACYWLWGRDLPLALCAHVELGRLWGEGSGIKEEKSGVAFWLAPRISVRALWLIREWAGLSVELGCAFPLLRHHFILEEIEQARTVVHRPAGLAPRAQLGGELRF